MRGFKFSFAKNTSIGIFEVRFEKINKMSKKQTFVHFAIAKVGNICYDVSVDKK